MRAHALEANKREARRRSNVIDLPEASRPQRYAHTLLRTSLVRFQRLNMVEFNSHQGLAHGRWIVVVADVERASVRRKLLREIALVFPRAGTDGGGKFYDGAKFDALR